MSRTIRRIAERLRHGIRSWGLRKRPRHGKRILLLAHYDPRGLQTIRENVAALRRHSRHRYEICNLFKLLPRHKGLRIPDWISLRDYDAVFIHCTLAYDPDVLEGLDALRREKLTDYRGMKILMKQDETYRVAGLLSWISRADVSLILTCLRPEDVRTVYPTSVCPRTRFFHTLTGYVTPDMRSLAGPPDGLRDIDIGYRGSLQPYSFGRLCYEKRRIGDLFVDICRSHGLTYDISSRWEDRFFGKKWYAFLGRCKATLGVESGASIFDFDGRLERLCNAYLAEHPDADFETVHALYLAPHENVIHYAQVSPRHFEAAACRTLQIMYEGRFSGIFEPGRHYLPLRRDLGNLDQVLAAFADPSTREQITAAAFDEIIMNDAYLYGTFISQLDDVIEALH